jgi:hypothetical protein
MLFGGKLEENHFSAKRGILQKLLMLFFISINCILNGTEVDDILQNFILWIVRFLKMKITMDFSEKARKFFLEVNLFI